MNAIIERILIFGENNEKREVKLTPGLNIVTGDSKTGKSALLEIVDYCLFASRSTIPKGVIENFSELYSIVLKASEKYIVIARPSAKTGNSSKAYLKVETTEQFLENISSAYFSNIEPKPLKIAQAEVEKHLGLSSLNTSIEDDGKDDKTSLRSAVSFLFQHQNLIANKHSIFYRFEDFYKRKKTIADFPILIGWTTSEYFLYFRELEKKQKELKDYDKLVKSLKLKDDEIQVRLKSIIENYFSVIGLELEAHITLTELKKIAKNLPNVSEVSYADENLKGKIQEKNIDREMLKSKLGEVEELLTLLEANSTLSQGHADQLRFLEMTSQLESNGGSLVCPVCRSTNTTISDEINAIYHSREELKTELAKISTYKEDNSQQIEDLRKQKYSLKRQITKISSEIDALEQQDKELQGKKPLRDLAFQAKGMAEANIKNLLSKDGPAMQSTDIEDLKNQVEWLKGKIAGFDLDSKIKDAEVFLSEKMTQICSKLDFEEELKPGVLRFSLKDFSFYYHFKNEDKILLSEMGSGANWLACHLSLFIALLYLNCKTEKSAIPSFLIIDQPSQVYFPAKFGEVDEGSDMTADENILQVQNIFKVIIHALKTIDEDCGFMPQIIVMEHADEEEFKPYVRARWKKAGNKLI